MPRLPIQCALSGSKPKGTIEYHKEPLYVAALPRREADYTGGSRMKREGTLGTASRQDTRAQWALRAVLGIGIAALLVAGGHNWTAWAQTDRFVSPFGDDMGGTNHCTSPDTPAKPNQNRGN